MNRERNSSADYVTYVRYSSSAAETGLPSSSAEPCSLGSLTMNRTVLYGEQPSEGAEDRKSGEEIER